MNGEKSAKMDSDKLSLEAAIDKCGFGLYGFLMTCLTGCMLFSLACVAYGNPFIVPTSACELQTTTYQQGILASSTIASLLLGGCVWSYLADTRGRRAMLLIALIGGGLFNMIATLSVNWIMLLICQLSAGLFAAGVYSVSITLISESIPMAYRNAIVLIVCSIMLLSYGSMALLAIPIIPLKFSYYIPTLGIYWNSWRTLMLVYCIPNIVSAIGLYFMQESPKFVYTMKDEAKALEVLKVIYRINNWRSKKELQLIGLIKDESIMISEKRAAKDQIVPLFKFPLLKYTIIMLFMNIAQQLTAFVMWIPTIADQVVRLLQAGESTNLTVCNIIDLDPVPEDPDATPCALDETSLLIVFGVGVLQSMFNIMNSVLINHVGRRNLTMIITSVCGVSGVLVNLVPNIFGSAVFFCILILGIVVPGLCAAICVALFPTNLRVMAIEITMVAQYLGNFASIQIVNVLLEVNCASAFYIFGTLFASIAIAASFLPDDRKFQEATPTSNKVENSQIKTHI